jgi:transglutaminase-like putative cysteine protease
VPEYEVEHLDADVARVLQVLKYSNPIWSYAVDVVSYELGSSGGTNAVAVNFSYIHDREDIRRINDAKDLEICKKLVYASLDACNSGVVIYTEDYQELDYQQLVEDYAQQNPHRVMEIPLVTVNVYPNTGASRVIEIKFSYKNSRETLRTMQSVVQPMFAAAAWAVNADAETPLKYAQVYSYLMGRYDYRIDTSITPAYSLLRYGVGDHHAFAVVFAGMCRSVELECQVVTGTRNGKSWFWNMINVDGTYYHVDLLRSYGEEGFCYMTDEQMTGYVWDYTAYPACGIVAENKASEKP